jgi:hypothetical protein
MCAGFGIDKLGADPHPLAGPSDVTFEHITYAEFAPDLLYVDGFTLERKCGVVRDHEGAGKSRQLGRNVLGQAIDEIVLPGITTDIGKRQYDNGEARHTGGRDNDTLRRTGAPVGSLIAKTRTGRAIECDIEMTLSVVADVSGHAYAARLRDAFQAHCHVHSITENVATISDDVPDVDANAEFDPLLLRQAGVAFGHPPLDINGTAHSVDNAREVSEHPIASTFNDPPSVWVDLGADEDMQMLLQLEVGPFLVQAVSRL